jgi:hypothetical protein
VGLSLIKAFASKTMSNRWDLKQSLFQFENYVDICEVLELEIANINLPGGFREQELAKRNENVLTVLLNKYWLAPVKDYLVTKWRPL